MIFFLNQAIFDPWSINFEKWGYLDHPGFFQKAEGSWTQMFQPKLFVKIQTPIFFLFQVPYIFDQANKNFKA